jgi:hypothetical protein
LCDDFGGRDFLVVRVVNRKDNLLVLDVPAALLNSSNIWVLQTDIFKVPAKGLPRSQMPKLLQVL